MVDLPEDEDTPEKRVDKIFHKMDKVRNVFLIKLKADGFLLNIIEAMIVAGKEL